MSALQGMADVSNTFLSRREITCNFSGLGGRLTKLEAVDMVVKEYSLDGKIVIPISLRNHVGNDQITGTFYVYEDETLAKSHVDPMIFARLEKAKTKVAEKEKEAAAKEAEDKPDAKEGSSESDNKPEQKAETKEDKPDAKEGSSESDNKPEQKAETKEDKPDAKEGSSESDNKPEQKAETKEDKPKNEEASS